MSDLHDARRATPTIILPITAPITRSATLQFTPLAALLSGLLLSACAGPQAAPPELVQARLSVASAQADPAVSAHALPELKKAGDTLERANHLLGNGSPVADISSTAHVADQQARTAMAIGLARSNDIAIAGAELERERTRADIRSVEAGRAKAQAASAQAQTLVAQDQASNAQAQASAAQAQTRDARRVASAADQRASGAEQRASGAERRATGAEERASGAEQQSAAALNVMAGAQIQAAEMQKKLDALQAKRTERGMLVTLGDVLFETNRADVRPAAQVSLRKLADFLVAYPDRFVLIEGHTDNVGSASYNEGLSLRRAEAVDAALSDLGVPGSRMDTAGYGEEYPVADNKTSTARALNRRVEVYIADDDDQPVRTRR